MKPFVVAVLATALSTVSTLAFSQSAKADYPEDHHREYREYREDRPYYRHWDDHPRYEEHRWHERREYYPRRFYDEGYYRHPRPHLEVIFPVIIR
jgi:hypothetical protein